MMDEQKSWDQMLNDSLEPPTMRNVPEDRCEHERLDEDTLAKLENELGAKFNLKIFRKIS